jgi:hypothetical protein
MNSASSPLDDQDDGPADDPAFAQDRDRAYDELGTLLHRSTDSLDQVLGRIAQLARRVVPAHPDVSVTLLADDLPRTAVFTGEPAAQLDERQYAAGYGPCLDAAISGHTIRVDTADPVAYPAFGRAARRHHITEVVSVGLPIPQRTLGALNLYSKDPEPLPPSSVRTVEGFAAYAALAVANAASDHSTTDLAEHVQDAMRSRALIDQAKGILMARLQCDPEAAFAVLTQRAQRERRHVREVAAAVVEDAVSS